MFISYSHTNTGFAGDLYTKLRSIGFPFWRRCSKMEGSEAWWRQIQAVLENMDTLFRVYLPKALESAAVTQ
ncbi:MAG: TIR domain-containing protein [Chloroflexi bacterium CFX4]|nr:TIR domain-containing protein [Chloroflexi bacterium CFX4]